MWPWEPNSGLSFIEFGKLIFFFLSFCFSLVLRQNSGCLYLLDKYPATSVCLQDFHCHLCGDWDFLGKAGLQRPTDICDVDSESSYFKPLNSHHCPPLWLKVFEHWEIIWSIQMDPYMFRSTTGSRNAIKSIRGWKQHFPSFTVTWCAQRSWYFFALLF